MIYIFKFKDEHYIDCQHFTYVEKIINWGGYTSLTLIRFSLKEYFDKTKVKIHSINEII